MAVKRFNTWIDTDIANRTENGERPIKYQTGRMGATKTSYLTTRNESGAENTYEKRGNWTGGSWQPVSRTSVGFSPVQSFSNLGESGWHNNRSLHPNFNNNTIMSTESGKEVHYQEWNNGEFKEFNPNATKLNAPKQANQIVRVTQPNWRFSENGSSSATETNVQGTPIQILNGENSSQPERKEPSYWDNFHSMFNKGKKKSHSWGSSKMGMGDFGGHKQQARDEAVNNVMSDTSLSPTEKQARLQEINRLAPQNHRTNAKGAGAVVKASGAGVLNGILRGIL